MKEYFFLILKGISELNLYEYVFWAIKECPTSKKKEEGCLSLFINCLLIY